MKADQASIDDTYPWVSWLPEVMFTLNITKSITTKETPYHLVYGCMPPMSIGGLDGTRICIEADLDQVGGTVSVSNDDDADDLETVSIFSIFCTLNNV